MAHSVSFAHMNRVNHSYVPSIVLSKESLRHQLAMAKYQARREMDLRVAQKVDTLQERKAHLERVGIIARRKKHTACLTLLIIGQIACAYIAVGLFFCLFF